MPLPITCESIESYARLRGLSDEDVEDLLAAVLQLEPVFARCQKSPPNPAPAGQAAATKPMPQSREIVGS